MRDRLREIAIRPDSTVREAMAAIDRGGVEIALVVDAGGRLLGTVTDGDLRRALLRGASLCDSSSGLFQRTFSFVDERATRAEVLDLMRARTLEQIPIVDKDGRLVGLHLLREIVGGVARSNWAVIMAGGRGERLRPITDSVPKPMVKVAGRPILERIVLHLVGYGIRRIFLAVLYKAELIEEHFGDGQAFGCVIEYLREPHPLGTGGALSLLPRTPETPLLVLNGDLVTQFDVARMLTLHSERGHKVTVAVHEYLHTVPFGVIDVDGDRIVALREKPTLSWQANAGVYVLAPELVERVPKRTNYPLPALIEECLERTEPVGVFNIHEDWIDVGQQEELRHARGEREYP